MTSHSIRACLALVTAAAAIAAVAPRAAAQGNYEIQVYGSETVPRGRTMVELHSNYTVDGQLTTGDGTYSTNHAQHETLELTHGFSDWLEIGFYVFTSAHRGEGVQWVGDHIRPRVRVPESWGWPVGVSVSQEIGYQRAEFSPDTWTYELRPIVDRKWGPWYAAFNPALEKSLHGPGASRGFEFSPNATIGRDVTRRVNVAVEYYGAWGPVRGLDAPGDRAQLIFGAVNLDLGPAWEFNVGYGQSVNAVGDRRLLKLILGRLLGQ
jgi:hypothetical protein